MMKILYLVSAILLVILLIILRKKNQKMDFIITLFVTLMTFTCYNILVCMILKLLTIPITLLSLAIVNYIISAVILIKIVKTKQIQSYIIAKKDILAIFIITIIGLSVAYINFGYPFDISYVQVDASNHYGMAMEFYQKGDIYLSSIPGAYINYGIVFKIFLELFELFDGYKLFIICEIIKLLFSGILFYLAIKQVIKNKNSFIIAIIFSIIYMLAYPLNGMLSGFVYLQMAINIVNTLLIVLVSDDNIDDKNKITALFLLCFGLIFTYYILVPPVYIAIFLYMLKDYKKNNRVKCIKNLIKVFAIPCISAIIFFILPSIINSQTNFNPASNMTSQSAEEGYIYVSYYSTFIFFVPLGIYYIVSKIKGKKIDFLSIMLISNVIYIIIALILKKCGMLARYYCMKPYYMLWLVVLVASARASIEILNSNIEKTYKVLMNIVIFTYVIMGIYVTSVKPCGIKVFEDENESILSMYNIYALNKGVITHSTFETIYTNEELETLKRVTKEFDENTKVIYYEDGLQKEWLRRLLLKKDNYDTNYVTMSNLSKNNGIEKYLINQEDKVYVICYKNTFIKKYFLNIINELDKKLNVVAEEGKLTIYSNK